MRRRYLIGCRSTKISVCMMLPGEPALEELFYKTKGSHGCINMPYEKAQELYGYIEKGTPVICYHLAGTERSTESELEK